MKMIMTTAAALSLAIVLNSATVFAESPKAASSNTNFQTAETQAFDSRSAVPHYEWQYHYVGHHPHYKGGWVLVR